MPSKSDVIATVLAVALIILVILNYQSGVVKQEKINALRNEVQNVTIELVQSQVKFLEVVVNGQEVELAQEQDIAAAWNELVYIVDKNRDFILIDIHKYKFLESDTGKRKSIIAKLKSDIKV